MKDMRKVFLLFLLLFSFTSPLSVSADEFMNDFDTGFDNMEIDSDSSFDMDFEDPWESESVDLDWEGNVSFFKGMKKLAHDDWQSIDSHDEWGIVLDLKKKKWPVSMVISYYASDVSDSSNFVEGNTSEISFGVRKKWYLGKKYYVYAGGGQSQIYAEIRSTSGSVSSDEDTGIGYWLETGIHSNVYKSFTVGFDLRWSSAKVELFNMSGDAGGLHYGLSVGTDW